MRLQATLILSLALVLSAACKKDEPKPVTETPKTTAGEQANDAKTDKTDKPDTATRTDKPAGEDADAKKGKKPVVTLLEPGAEPRRELRYKVDKGLKQTLETNMQMEMENAIGGKPAPQTVMPPMLMTMTMEVTEVGDNVFTYGYEMTKADVGEGKGVNPMVAKAIKTELAKMVGMKGKAKVDGLGMTLEASVEIPPGVPAQAKQMMKGMQQSMDQMSSPLPTEAVGKGAKWRVDQVINQNGILMTQQATFELVELTDDGASLVFQLVQNAEPQTFRPPGVPSEAKLNMLKGKGKGKSKISFSRLAPVESSVVVQTETALEIAVGTPQVMNTKTKMTMSLKGK